MVIMKNEVRNRVRWIRIKFSKPRFGPNRASILTYSKPEVSFATDIPGVDYLAGGAGAGQQVLATNYGAPGTASGAWDDTHTIILSLKGFRAR